VLTAILAYKGTYKRFDGQKGAFGMEQRQHDTTLNRLKAVDLPRLKKPGYHHDGGGLYLQVRPGRSGYSRSWVFRYTRHGKARIMGLGPLDTIGLAEAREKAREARKALLEGVDPINTRAAERTAQRLAEATSMTFRQSAEAYIASHEAGWKSAIHAKQWPSTLAMYAYSVFGDLPVASINTGLVMKAIEPIWTAKPETAGRVRGRIEAVLDWAKTRGYREGENPARWRGHLENLLPKRSKVARVEHHEALPYQDIAGFMAQLRAQAGTAARTLEFTILTAARTSEVIGARWCEVNVAERVWTIPGSRMKAGRDHRVPLSERALALLGEPGAPDGFLFPGSKPGQPLSNMAMLKVLQRMGLRTASGGITVHGFRSSFIDWATEQTNFPAEMREMALAHTVGDKVEAAYRRGDLFDRRRELMAAWATSCDPEAAPEKVVPLRAHG
jgi:integrase